MEYQKLWEDYQSKKREREQMDRYLHDLKEGSGHVRRASVSASASATAAATATATAAAATATATAGSAAGSAALSGALEIPEPTEPSADAASDPISSVLREQEMEHRFESEEADTNRPTFHALLEPDRMLALIANGHSQIGKKKYGANLKPLSGPVRKRLGEAVVALRKAMQKERKTKPPSTPSAASAAAVTPASANSAASTSQLRVRSVTTPAARVRTANASALGAAAP